MTALLHSDLPANVKVFSFYINFVLISAFVGMGAGHRETRPHQSRQDPDHAGLMVEATFLEGDTIHTIEVHPGVIDWLELVTEVVLDDHGNIGNPFLFDHLAVRIVGCDEAIPLVLIDASGAAGGARGKGGTSTRKRSSSGGPR